MSNHSETFKNKGYIVLPQALDAQDMTTLELSSKALYQRADQLLAELAESGERLSDFYKRQQNELIVVPEIDNPLKVCRYEYIDGYSETINREIMPKLKGFIEALTGSEFVLFKDKCNAKNPGGGAFDPHQDVIAYDQFQPVYHITAAIFLDDATLENGCLNFPENYLQDVAGLETEKRETPLGMLPILPSYDGGPDNGNIRQEVCDQIRWNTVTARKGDVVLFDSYVPHFSEKNDSQKTRRAMFFTFNAKADGNFYEAYYGMKRQEFDNPKFHVATPTAHAKLEN
ncbi:phytanoyl-CoA dioxygenase family protein [Marinobacterium jannaschii]|uniref:phytanoyl-CoA dioxygenase family protein n=1 Tax=Marinobacterium jannaschii TaxID=64970 RepID=UPI0004842545|nr:phytanoyl-CoA dioxygenase family protein [Marinobacterium jannaschii]